LDARLRKQAEDGLDERRLTGAGHAHKTEHLSLGQIQIDTLQHRSTGISNIQIADL